MKAQESHVFEDDEYEDLDRDEDEMDEEDWANAPYQNAIEEAFLHSSQTIDPYVNEAIDASLDYGYFNLLSEPSTASHGSIYYSSLPSKPLLDSIKPKAITTLLDAAHLTKTQYSIQPRVFLTDDMDDQHKIQFIVDEFNLNKDQTLAFRIIAEHSIGYGKFGQQLRMGVFGEGGTGKSRLIAAIRAWFTCIH